MVDWLSSMQQTFEYYTVDPATWGDEKLLDTVKSCTIDRDEEDSTLGSATLYCTESIGECYVRVYLIPIQNGKRYKVPLGTFLVQTPSTEFDGKTQNISMDAYTPLLELREKLPPLAYAIASGENVMEAAYRLCRENVRAPVVAGSSTVVLYDDFVADLDDDWISFLTDLIAYAKYKFGLDEKGRILFSPKQDIASLQPVWTYDDTNSSILYPEITVDRDLYGIPNVVEVVYSTDAGYYYAKVVNDDPNSPISTVSRGREIMYRESNPELPGTPTQGQIDEYAEQLLRNLSSLEYTLSYMHGYCPVRIGDCVRLNYSRAGLKNIKAKVIRQSIKCEPGCPVTETAVFTTKLWG